LLEKSASLWRSGLHLNTAFQERVMISTFHGHLSLPYPRYVVKCSLLWLLVRGDLFIRDYNTDINLSWTWAIHKLSSQRRPNFHTIDPLQYLVTIVPLSRLVAVIDAEKDQ
jgi:hypothetical protein